jgi:hypothetical protein
MVVDIQLQKSAFLERVQLHFRQFLVVFDRPPFRVLGLPLDRGNCERIFWNCQKVIGLKQDAFDVLLPDVKYLVVENESRKFLLADVDYDVVVGVFVDGLEAEDQFYRLVLILLLVADLDVELVDKRLLHLFFVVFDEFCGEIRIYILRVQELIEVSFLSLHAVHVNIANIVQVHVVNDEFGVLFWLSLFSLLIWHILIFLWFLHEALW